jgi:hypothetical protein
MPPQVRPKIRASRPLNYAEPRSEVGQLGCATLLFDLLYEIKGDVVSIGHIARGKAGTWSADPRRLPPSASAQVRGIRPKFPLD